MNESTARAERINLQSSPSPSYTWEVAQKPVFIRVPFVLIDRLEREVVENFRSLTSRGSEVGGILLGSVQPGNPACVHVEEYEAIPCDYSRGPLYRLSDADMGRFERAIEQRIAQGGLSVVGFFRSHTRKGLSMDAEDLSFFAARFRDPYNIALLVRPFATKASTAGFFIWENGAVQGEQSYLEFPFRSAQLSPSRANSPALEMAPAADPAVSPAAPATVEPVAPKPVTRAQIVPIASRREVALPVAPPPVEAAPPPIAAPPTPTAAPVAAAAAPAPAKVQPAAKPEPPKPVAKPELPKPVAKVEAKPVAKPVAVKVEAPKPEAKAEPKPESKPETRIEPKQEPKVDAKAAAAAAPKTDKPAKQAAAPLAVDEPAPGRGKSLILIVAAAAALIVAVVLFLYPGVLRHGSRGSATSVQDASSLSLRVERTGTDLLLTWNRDAAPIRSATHAVLSISDGERHENYDMDLSQLKNGSIMYSPLTADVSFRMEVTGQSQNKTASESVRALRTRPSPMPDDAAQAAAQAAAKPAPATPNGKTPNGTPQDEASAQPAEEVPAPVKAVQPSRTFNTASLAGRLRPTTPSDIPLPDAPTLNTSTISAAPAPSIGGASSAPAPFIPSAPPAPAPTQAERRAAANSSNPGGQISQAQVLVSKQPEYPKLARQMGVKGSVELVATIGADGHVKSVKVEKGHPLLVKAATDAVMQWVYKPTLLNGQPVQNDTHITLNFLGDR